MGAPSTIFVTSGFNPGAWHFVAAVSDAVAGTSTVYLDGVAAGTSGVCAGSVNAYPFSIGKNVTWSDNPPDGYDNAFFPGSIDEVAAFDHALPAATIQAMYQTATNGLSATSTNALLKALQLNPAGLAGLTTTFASNTFSYTATNAYGNTPTITVTNADLTATNRLIFNGVTNLLASGVASSVPALTPLPLGVTNTVKVQVTAQDGVTVQTYTVGLMVQPNVATKPVLTNSVSGATLSLSWGADRLGYRLLMQTNNLAKGVSGNLSDWAPVAGSAAVTATNLPTTKTNLNEYYRLVYP